MFIVNMWYYRCSRKEIRLLIMSRNILALEQEISTQEAQPILNRIISRGKYTEKTLSYQQKSTFIIAKKIAVSDIY